MGTASRNWWQGIGLLAVLLVAPAAWSQGVGLARLDADPVPARVLAGEFDDRFVPAADHRTLRESKPGSTWWRLTAQQPFHAAVAPQLVLAHPSLSEVEVWTPGEAVPVRRTLMGRDSDPRYSTRALVTALPGGLAAGDRVYLRVVAPGPLAMPLSIEPLEQVHRSDLLHVAWRTAALSSMLVLAVLALGFWIGVGERSYAYLMITLLAQVGGLASVGGEWRAWPWMAQVVGSDPRAGLLFGLIALIAGVQFLTYYLDLRERQPGLFRLLKAGTAAAALLLAATLASHAGWIGLAGKVLGAAVGALLLWASVRGVRSRQRTAVFLLVSLGPLIALLAIQAGAAAGVWAGPGWMPLALPGGLAFAALVITVGQADQMHQLRRDRDQASRLASYDTLTGATSRAAIEERLKEAVASAHGSGQPLSVVFFDIDRFKQINDRHGHRVGDQCLRIIAMRTRNRLRTYDQIGRYGGDELVVILPNTELQEAVGVAENLRSAVNCRPLSIDGVMLEASLSLGVAQLAPGETGERLLERADAALYESKSGGRDRVTGRITGTHPALPAHPVAQAP